MIFMKYNNTNRSIYLPVLFAVTLIAGILTGIYFPGRNRNQVQPVLRARHDKINSVLNIIEADYVDSINRNDLVEAAIPAILKKLDPHSVYIPAKDLARANEPLQGNFDGIGISFNLLTDTILIISTIPGGPSEKIGLLPGDKIIYVNDSLVAGKQISEERVMGMLKGPRGTIVNIKVLRKGVGDLLPFEIRRDKIPINSVEVSYMLNSNTGYIKIINFAITTFDEFQRSMNELRKEGMTRLILDLRQNSGGVMESAIRIADQFLEKGQLIVFTKGRTQPKNEARASGKGEFRSGDLIVLIDEWSASASEILAGAVQDNDRGTIIGRRSFGKGLVQEPVSFADGSGIRLTIARYYTPTGRSIQKPYNNGFDDYFDDLNSRFRHGEFEIPDSIHFADSLKFITPGGRVVYGGGGIMPDVFVPLDTTGISPYFLAVRPQIYRFALKYTENNREKLQKFTETTDLEKYLNSQRLMEQFTEFVAGTGVKKDPEGLKISGLLIHTQLKAYIARNILDNKGFYPILDDIDNTLQVAIKYMEKNK
jgi:carboxyl-terminal processing protease